VHCALRISLGETYMNPVFELLPTSGHQSVFQPGEQATNWLGLEVVRLDRGETWEGALRDQEAALVVLSGRCDITVGLPATADSKTAAWTGLGSRSNIFSGSPAAVYAPRGSRLKVVASQVPADNRLELAIAKAPCEIDLRPVLVQPADVKVVSSGAANWRRDVRLIIPPGSPISQRLIVGETLNPPGNWSGIPPHKHDEVTRDENFLEEFYLFKVQPADSFGLQVIYRRGEGGQHGTGHMIGNDTVTVMRGGYHPTVAAPGTTLCYLWVLSGEDKAYDISLDPRFTWLSNAEAVMREMCS
jgi:5-deoxy-glucuronate isomerase